MNRMDAVFDKLRPILETFGREQGDDSFRETLTLDPLRPQMWRLGVSLYL